MQSSNTCRPESREGGNAWPKPLPSPVNLGGKHNCISSLHPDPKDGDAMFTENSDINV